MSSPEHAPQSLERSHEVAKVAGERKAELLESGEVIELLPEHTQEALEATARHEANEQAISHESPKEERQAQPTDTHHVQPSSGRQSREQAYRTILSQTRGELRPAERAFSKVIHQPIVEQTSAAVGATIARPNAILFGALFALIISGGVYAIAKYYNYQLSGFEAIGSFGIGWIFGTLVDFIRLAFRRH